MFPRMGMRDFATACLAASAMAMGTAECIAKAPPHVEVPCQDLSTVLNHTQASCDDGSGWTRMQNGSFIRAITVPPRIHLIEAPGRYGAQ